MTTTALTTELPGRLQIAALTTAELTLELTASRSNLPLDGAVQLSADDVWVYHSVAAGTGMAIAAGQGIVLPIPFGQTITCYVKAVGTANLYVLTVR